MPQKHAAWQELISTMPDMVIEERINCPRYDSLHGFLRQYMALEDRLLDDFFRDDENFVYRFDTLYSADYGGYNGYEEGESVYRSFKDGLAAGKESIAEYAEDFLDFSVTRMEILSGTSKTPWRLRVRVNEEGVPLGINVWHTTGAFSEEEFDLLYSFEGMWIDVPTPFRKGDLVFTNYQNLGHSVTPFVLTSLCTDKDTERRQKICERLLKQGDSTDMTAYGCFLNDRGEPFPECEHDYLSLEYYRGKLSGINRLLEIIQSYYWDDTGMEAFVCAYQYILSDSCTEKLRSEYKYILDGWDLLDG